MLFGLFYTSLLLLIYLSTALQMYLKIFEIPQNPVASLRRNIGSLTSSLTSRATSVASKLSRSTIFYISSAFVGGFALGATIGIFGAELLLPSISRLRSHLSKLEQEVENIQQQLGQIHPGDRPNKVALEAYLESDDEEQASSESDDEFFDLPSGRSSEECSGDFFSLKSSSSSSSSFTSLFSLAPAPNQPLPKEISEELDTLAETACQAEPGFNALRTAEAVFSRCLDFKKQYKHYPGFLWRFARSAHLMWLATTSNANGGGEDESHWIDVGLSIARAAVGQVETTAQLLMGEQKIDAARSYEWLAVFVGLLASAASTAVSRRIELGYEFKKHIDTSLDLDPSNAYCHILKGQWCFVVYNLSWWERQLASRLFAAPPTATLEDARSEFLEVEKLEPNHWVTNAVYLAKCELAESKYQEAAKWLKSANQMLRSSLLPSTTNRNARGSRGDGGDNDDDAESTLTRDIGDSMLERRALRAEVDALMRRCGV